MTDRNAYVVAAANLGGFVVYPAIYDSAEEDPTIEFASTTLDEALRYIRQQLFPYDSEKF